LSIAGFEWNVGMRTTPTSENVVVTQTRDQVDLESEDVGYRCLRALATTERMPTPGPPGTAVRFPVSCELSFGSPAYSRTSRLWSQPMRTREIQNGEGVNRAQRSGSQGETLREPVNGLAQRGIFAKQGLDLADRVQDRGVIHAAEGAADLGERGVGELPRQIHGDLTREGHRFRPILGLQLGELEPETFGNLPLDQLDRDARLFVAPEVRERLLSEVHGRLTTRHRTDCDHPGQRALELPDV